MKIDLEKETQASELKGSLLLFTRFFYKHLTGRDFIISIPHGRESHHITISKAFTKLFREQRAAHGMIINLPPGYGKSVMTSMWVAWCYAHYSDCNFLYISYSHELAAAHTSFIKQVMTSKMYKYLFDVEISSDTRAKDHFMTNGGGSVAAFGSSGAVTGRNAGSPGLDRFSGCVVIDDAHKPNEIHSDSIRESVIRNYTETIMQRPRDINVPIVFIGQRLHEDDLAAYLMSGKDVREWSALILKGIDDAGNALYPEVQSLKYLRDLQEKQPFVFSSQIQQEPVPSGGALFKPEWFVLLDFEPTILATFITADTAETNKSYNDATVFSFWGIYEIETMGRKTGQLGLHWLDCLEIRIEPKDLKEAFLDFWQDCARHPIPPWIAAIEKKSTGVTLLSVLKDIRGIQVRDIERNAGSGGKSQRFIETQASIASKLISFTSGAKHAQMCIDHMSKITATDTHRHDDIADTCVDAIKIGLIDKLIPIASSTTNKISSKILAKQSSTLKLRDRLKYDHPSV
jgi:predicted phage terminase large subunit-like protein